MLYAFVGLTGLTSIITALVPASAVLPILVCLGISSYEQAFEVVDRKYYRAVIMASLPLVMSFMMDNVAEGSLAGFWAFDAGAASSDCWSAASSCSSSTTTGSKHALPTWWRSALRSSA